MADSMRDRMVAVVSDLIETDPKAALVLADISAAYWRDLLQRFPDRAVNVGIMEQTMVGVAAGYALEGFHTIVHSIAPFVVERPFEQIKLDFCYQGLGGTFVSIGASYDYGTDGMTHQSPGDVSVLRTLPGMQICVPGTADELETLLRHTYGDGALTYLRTSVQQNHAGRPVRFGKLHVEREGGAGVVVAVGPMLDRTLAATRELDLTVLYATTVVPFDEKALARAVRKASPHVILVEPYYEGTLVPEVARSLRNIPARIEAIGVPRRILDRYGPPERMDQDVGLTADGIRARIARFLEA